MKTAPKKPLMLAYIIFLFSSVAYHITAKCLNFDFPAWNRIILAATIASFAFAFASYFKFFLRTSERYLGYSKEYLDLIKKRQDLRKDIANKNNEDDSNNYDEESKKITIEQITHLEKSIDSFSKWGFIADVAGFLVFFCVLVFDPLYTALFFIQDICTLLAFLAILIEDYVEAVELVKFENAFFVLKHTAEQDIKNLKKHNE